MKTRILYLLLMLAPLSVVAQQVNVNVGVTEPSEGLFSKVNAVAKEKSGLLRPIYWVKTLIDSSAVATVDRSYIEQPEQEWAVEARTTLNQSTLKMETQWDENADNMTLWTKSKNGLSTSVGLWLGYRGYGFGYSKEIGSTNGSTFSFGAMGGSFGINLRIGSYKSDMPDLYVDGIKLSYYDTDDDRLEDPIKVRSLFLDGYYMLNGKHFSYAAAYDQSLIQRRSAGSIVVGGMYYHSKADYSSDSNWLLAALMQGVGKVKYTQGSLGVGYAYNWVPARGWLVSAMAMPMLSLYNRTTMYTYDFDVYNPNPYLTGEALLYDPYTTIRLTDEKEEKTDNKINWNYDMRLCVVYNWERWYLRVYGHYNHFRYGDDLVSGRFTDWTAYASLGFRF